MLKTITIPVCEYPGNKVTKTPPCETTSLLAPCVICKMMVCPNHRFEGIKGGTAVFLCWMDSPVKME